MTAHTSTVAPGFIALHGNRAEDMAHTVAGWLRLNPLAPLEEEVVLVQSNGMAEWFKMDMAQRHGVCAATRVELPARFLWRTYRQVLGPHAVPRQSALDKVPMTWRLMGLLPTLLEQPDFVPVRAYLRPGESDRLLQLATQLADLFDQYQNHRTDWLQDWANGLDQLRQPGGALAPLPAEQRWQAQLWRALVQGLSEGERSATRPQLHHQVLQRLHGSDSFAGRVARRVVVYGMSQLPSATLETLAALSRHSQVLLAIPNPCRHDWGHIMEGRELFATTRQRQVPRAGGEPLAQVSLEDMHAHAHPLLAAWGRQGRDFIRLLDAFDDAQATLSQFDLPRIDVFDEATDQPDTPLLLRVQHRIRDLEPARFEGDKCPIPASDQSICFQVAHSGVRELEALQDRLLQWLADSAHTDAPLQPRDVVVMVPDIEAMAPAIRAVFGQYPRHDPRYIPFDIADLGASAASLLLTAWEWLMRVPTQRCGLSELLDLLEVPAVAARFGLTAEQLPPLAHWMQGAGLRWGLNAAHRQHLGLGACGEQNSAWFGLQRMLLGYATGSLGGVQPHPDWAHIEPYAEVGGLDAELAGSLAHLVQALLDWWALALQPATPVAWAERCRALLAAFFKPQDEADQAALSALDDALRTWTLACEQAEFVQPVDLATCRQAWQQALAAPRLEQRFRAGGITFCTLMPMRAIPFEVVCLLGMNDGDYPRQTPRNDFDLMASAGQFRPGDRSRRQDDRQLMLEALLSARRTLCISWTGHSVRDNSEQPPSVLVSQLRDYLSTVWGKDVLAQRTTVHPLQPFSRRYFEPGSGLHTWASEWRSLHQPRVPDATAPATPTAPPLPPLVPDAANPAATTVNVQRLAAFFRNPVKQFFKERLGVVFAEEDEATADEEAFDIQGLSRHQLLSAQLAQWPEAASCGPDMSERIQADLQRLRRSGALPMQGFGDLKQAELENTLRTLAQAWQRVGAAHPHRAPRARLAWAHEGVLLSDWLDPLYQSAPPRASGGGEPPAAMLQLSASLLLDKKGKLRPDKLLAPWLRMVASAASGHAVQGVLVAPDACLHLAPLPTDAAQAHLGTLLAVWLQGMQTPLPLPLKTGLVAAANGLNDGESSLADVYEGTDYERRYAEVNDPCLARAFPDLDSLLADGRLAELAPTVYGPMLDWLAHGVQVQAHD